MAEGDWDKIVGAIKNRINYQIVWHRKHGSNASYRRLLEIAVMIECDDGEQSPPSAVA